jgi:hypothetical protein
MRLDAELLKKTGVFALVSGEVTALVGGGYFLGQYIDTHWSKRPVFGVSLALVGLGLSCWRIWQHSRSWFDVKE